MSSIEEIINLPDLTRRLGNVIDWGMLAEVLEEIVAHSKVEFNFQE
jgi:hypothetical protein